MFYWVLNSLGKLGNILFVVLGYIIIVNVLIPIDKKESLEPPDKYYIYLSHSMGWLSPKISQEQEIRMIKNVFLNYGFGDPKPYLVYYFKWKYPAWVVSKKNRTWYEQRNHKQDIYEKTNNISWESFSSFFGGDGKCWKDSIMRYICKPENSLIVLNVNRNLSFVDLYTTRYEDEYTIIYLDRDIDKDKGKTKNEKIEKFFKILFDRLDRIK